MISETLHAHSLPPALYTLRIASASNCVSLGKSLAILSLYSQSLETIECSRYNVLRAGSARSPSSASEKVATSVYPAQMSCNVGATAANASEGSGLPVTSMVVSRGHPCNAAIGMSPIPL